MIRLMDCVLLFTQGSIGVSVEDHRPAVPAPSPAVAPAARSGLAPGAQGAAWRAVPPGSAPHAPPGELSRATATGAHAWPA